MYQYKSYITVITRSSRPKFKVYLFWDIGSCDQFDGRGLSPRSLTCFHDQTHDLITRDRI